MLGVTQVFAERSALQIFLQTLFENLLDENYEEVFGYRAPGFGGYLGIDFQL